MKARLCSHRRQESAIAPGGRRKWMRRAVGLVVVLVAMMGVGIASGSPAGAASPVWGSPIPLDPIGTPTSVSCATVSFCAGVDTITQLDLSTQGGAGVWTGQSWAIGNLVDSQGGLTSVSCTSSSFCVGVDDSGDFVKYNGTSWSAPAAAEDVTGSLGSVSCPTTTFCMAADNFLGGAFLYDGTHWTDLTSQLPSLSGKWSSVSCPTSTFCMAVDAFGDAYSYNSGTWTAYSNMDPSLMNSDGALPPSSVACGSPTSCIAVDFQGDAYSFNGTSWSSASSIDASKGLTGISCPSSSFCLAVDNNGDALTFNGTSWSAPAQVDPTNSFTAVSCVSDSFCAASDDAGNGLFYAVSGTAPIIIVPQLSPATPGAAYGPVALQATNVLASTSPYTTTLKWKKVNLPKGLKLSSAGVLSGTPSAKLAAGPNSVTVQVTEQVITLNGKKKVKTKTTVQATIPLTIS